MGAQTLGILGYDGGEAAKIAHHSFIVPSFDMQVCEDIHLMFGHMVMKTYCQLDIRGVV
jgi:D-sedoheptulose 7-phosphate isomerase